MLRPSFLLSGLLAGVLTLALLITSPAASPRAYPGLRMGGDVKARHWRWASAAAQHVPLADARVWIHDGDPIYYVDDHTLYVPFHNARGAARQGWTAHVEEGLFLHELGHVYDFADMTPKRRIAFKSLVRTTCSWWAPHCLSNRWITSPTEMVDVPPGEMFAEMYAACALGLTQRGYQDAGFNSYGWVPPAGTDQALCDLIRRPTPIIGLRRSRASLGFAIDLRIVRARVTLTRSPPRSVVRR
jgi:hypothetical protein